MELTFEQLRWLMNHLKRYVKEQVDSTNQSYKEFWEYKRSDNHNDKLYEKYLKQQNELDIASSIYTNLCKTIWKPDRVIKDD